MDLIKLLQNSILDRKKYLSTITKFKDISTAFLLYIVMSIISNIVGIILKWDDLTTLTNLFGMKDVFLIMLFIVWLFIFMVISIISVFIYAGFTYLMLKILKGRGSFENTFNCIIYSFLPFYLFQILLNIPVHFLIKKFISIPINQGLIPSNIGAIALIVFLSLGLIVINIYAYFWYFISSLSLSHKISKLRVFVATFVIPLAIVVIIVLFLFILGGIFLIN